MIRVIDRTNKDLFAKSLDQLFRLRHDCFVKERGWHQFDKDGIYEQDQYDDDNAIYLASIDEQDDVIGCMRLYPSTLPHMLSEQFPYLVKGPVPRGDDTIEMTRMAIKPDSRGKRTYCELLIGMQEFCISRNILRTTALIRWLRMPIVQATGYHLEELGSVQEMEGDPVIVVMFEMSDTVLGKIRNYAGVQQSVMENMDIAAAARKIA